MYFKKLKDGSDEQYSGLGNVVAPFTNITNRALIDANCKVVGPVERIHFDGLNLLPKESGPLGERIFGISSGDSRIRFGGDWYMAFESSGHLTSLDAISGTPFCEITFYGTGLNLLFWNSAGTSREQILYIDGVSQGAFNVDQYDNTLTGRNYAPRQNVNVVRGLTKGWHTVRFDNNVATAPHWQGVEILNEVQDEITVLAGKMYKNGYEYILENDVTLPFKPASYTGANGGRVLIGIDPANGQVTQEVREVPSNPSFMTSADHGMEAVIYDVESRDFGRDRGDDFRTLGGSSSIRNFSMETNDFGLTCQDCTHGFTDGRILLPTNIADYYTFFFVGVGLDLIRQDNIEITSIQNNSVEIDGVNVGSLSSNGSTRTRVEKLASGLKFGSHTARIVMQDTANYSPGLRRFRVYQPKKPDVVEGFVELGEYNILADFEKPSTDLSVGEVTVANGAIMQSPLRNALYENNWSFSISPGQFKMGQEARSSTPGGTLGFNFMGDAFVHYFTGETNNSANIFVRVNGQLLTSTNFPSVTPTFVTDSGGIFDFTTGRLNQGTSTGNQKGCYLAIEGLDYGFHEVEFELTDANFIRNSGQAIKTPIYSVDFTIGNTSIKDIRNQLPVETEFLVKDVGQRVRHIKNVNQVLEAGNGFYIVWYNSPFNEGDKNINIGTQRGDKIVAVIGTSPYLSNNIFQTTSSAGAQETSIEFSAKVLNETQTDIFKD